MKGEVYKLTTGALLHDVGKIVYRCGDGRSHAESGYAFLKENAALDDQEILQQIRYHHASGIKKASLPLHSLAYITYLADNIAAAADRRRSDGQGYGFSRDLPQDSIFNLLNGNDAHMKYAPAFLDGQINYPTSRTIPYHESFYAACLDNIRDCVRGIYYNPSYINSLLEVLEANLTYIPSSTSKQEVADISLFDHSKLTAALACCIWEYLQEEKVEDYKTALYQQAEQFYQVRAFLLYSIDISGIQDFIYTIADDGALKALRARSFYLELLMEHLVDTILERVGLSRANCVYCGGGHAYLLLANTKETVQQITAFESDMNHWFLNTFGTSLYVAGGYAACSANELKNEPAGSYQQIFRTISNHIGERKLNRYTSAQLIQLNNQTRQEDVRECKVCHRTDRLGENGKCLICEGIERFSKAIQSKPFFAITTTKDGDRLLPLPDDCFLVAEDAVSLRQRMKSDQGYQRAYCKNAFFTGTDIATKLWVGDYQNGDSFQDLAQESAGIRRLAVLRADIDNLGQAFVSGFESEKYGQRYVTLSRTATFSRKLALFFKRHVNTLLENGNTFLVDGDDPARKATIVYSGGDDMFVIGAWDDILGFAVDLYDTLSRYSQGMLTISAGIGIYPEKYPIAAMARQTGALEDAAKAHPGKNAITLFQEDNTYGWEEFINQVWFEKFELIRDFFQSMPDYGKSFLYRLLELMRSREEKINLARYAYLLARMQPSKEEPEERQTLYRDFSQKMYQWMQKEEDCRQAITAIYIYLYTIRETTEGTEHGDH